MFCLFDLCNNPLPQIMGVFQVLRGRIDDSQGVVFWTPSKYLCTEILYCALIDKGRVIDESREWGISTCGTL